MTTGRTCISIGCDEYFGKAEVTTGVVYLAAWELLSGVEPQINTCTTRTPRVAELDQILTLMFFKIAEGYWSQSLQYKIYKCNTFVIDCSLCKSTGKVGGQRIQIGTGVPFYSPLVGMLVGGYYFQDTLDLGVLSLVYFPGQQRFWWTCVVPVFIVCMSQCNILWGFVALLVFNNHNTSCPCCSYHWEMVLVSIQQY